MKHTQITAFGVLNIHNALFKIEHCMRTREHILALEVKYNVREHSLYQRKNQWNKWSAEFAPAGSDDMFRNRIDKYIVMREVLHIEQCIIYTDIHIIYYALIYDLTHCNIIFSDIYIWRVWSQNARNAKVKKLSYPAKRSTIDSQIQFRFHLLAKCDVPVVYITFCK